MHRAFRSCLDGYLGSSEPCPALTKGQEDFCREDSRREPAIAAIGPLFRMRTGRATDRAAQCHGWCIFTAIL